MHSRDITILIALLWFSIVCTTQLVTSQNCIAPSSHPDEELISSDKNMVAKFLPPNVAALIHQGVLSSTKWQYRWKILEDLVLSVLDFLKRVHVIRLRFLPLLYEGIFPIEEPQPSSSTATIASLPADTDQTNMTTESTCSYYITRKIGARHFFI